LKQYSFIDLAIFIMYSQHRLALDIIRTLLVLLWLVHPVL
jgi:hypothetical protein